MQKPYQVTRKWDSIREETFPGANKLKHKGSYWISPAKQCSQTKDTGTNKQKENQTEDKWGNLKQI